MLTKIIYKNFRSNLKNYILFFLSNIVASMELFVFRGLKEIVLQIVKDTETAFLFRIDFTMALGMISVITIMLMAYAMIYYLKSRIRDYGLFIMMGMHKRMVFSLMLIEYVLGWVFSSILGLILGTGILYGIQFLLHKIAPLYFVRIVTANLNIYVYSIKFSIGIMIFTFFAVIVWIENHNLSSLIQAEEKIQKCPQKGYWTIAVIIGIILSVIAWFMFPSYEEVHYDAYFIWIIGGFLILTFGMGVLLEEIKKHEQFFYLKNVLQINQFSSKYQNNLMLVLMFFVIHFFALTYISTEISSLLPIETLLMFRLLSKVFILTALFLNSIFIMEIKVESEIPSYKKKQEFLRCMGMQKKERKALYLLEMQSVGMISLAAGIFMSVIHFIACLLRMEKAGEVNKWNFTKYWLVACLGYIALELLVQRGFALYITRKIEGGLKDEEKCIRS